LNGRAPAACVKKTMHAVKEGLVHYMYKGADRVGFICWVFGGAALHFIVLFSTLKEQRKKMDGCRQFGMLV